jgi:isocitrate/isopropylmalate dehydrogenase
VVIPGDGIGPEVIEAAVKALRDARFQAEYIWLKDVGIQRFRREGASMSEGDMNTLRQADAILKGPLETPKTGAGNYRSLTVELRRNLELFANVRPFKKEGIDTVVVRENTEDLYVARERETEKGAVAEREITRGASLRIHEFAFDYASRYARKRVTCTHKSNVLPLTDGLFLNTFWDVAKRFEKIAADEVTVDACSYRIQRTPGAFDILVTPNLYGDILSDQLAGAIGSLGLCGSMNVGARHALFEPIHGTAPDIAGAGTANPIGAIVAAAMMARHLGDDSTANIIDRAIYLTLKDPTTLTPDLGGNANCSEVTDQIARNIERLLE